MTENSVGNIKATKFNPIKICLSASHFRSENDIEDSNMEDKGWWSVEQDIADFLDTEGVHVVSISDARLTFFGPLATHRFAPSPNPHEQSSSNSKIPAQNNKRKYNSNQAQNHPK